MKRGEIGVGTVILFIAFILVAAIAAGVIIMSTGGFQGEVLETGDATRSEVASYIVNLEVYAEDGTDSQVDYFYHDIKLSPGAEPLRFVNLMTNLQLYNASESYSYNTSVDCTNATTLVVGGGYGITFKFRGESYRDHRLSFGDVASLCYRSPRPVLEGEAVRISILPAIGPTVVIDTNLPDVIARQRTAIYPKPSSFI